LNTEKFWDKYIGKLRINSVLTKSERWYVKRAEDYINAHNDLRLVFHNENTVTEYLESLGRNYRLTDWQFKQAVDAIKILFVDMLKAPWAGSFSWDDWLELARDLPVSHPTIARNFESGTHHQNDTTSNLSTLTNPQHKNIRKIFPNHFKRPCGSTTTEFGRAIAKSTQVRGTATSYGFKRRLWRSISS